MISTRPVLMLTFATVFAAAFTIGAYEQSADACSFAALVEHQLDPESTDTEAPAAPEVLSVEITRGNDCPDANSCADLGFLNLVLAPGSDDQTPRNMMGYRLDVLEGGLPGDDFLPEYDFRAMGDAIFLIWFDGATNDQEAFSATLQLTAIDAAGNQSAPTLVNIAHDGAVTCDGGLDESLGCTLSDRGDERGVLVIGLALGALWLSRWRRALA